MSVYDFSTNKDEFQAVFTDQERKRLCNRFPLKAFSMRYSSAASFYSFLVTAAAFTFPLVLNFAVLVDALIMAAAKTNHDDFKHALTLCCLVWRRQI